MPDLTIVRNAEGGFAYKPLRLTDPLQRGAPVFELQAHLGRLGYDLGPARADGILGKDTAAAIRKFQGDVKLTVDGVAGPVTQHAVVIASAEKIARERGIDPRRIRGQVEKESSGLVGVVTKVYPDGSYDRGAAQENSGIFPDEQRAFGPEAIDHLCNRILRFEKYLQGFVKEPYRRWNLAQGAWNRPAYACWLAGSREPSWAARPTSQGEVDQLEAYMADCAAYVPIP